MWVFEGHKFSYLLGRYLGVCLLACMVSLRSALWKLSAVFCSGYAYHLCIPTHAWACPWLPTSKWCCRAFSISVFPVGVQWCLIALICSSLMTCKVEHLFRCLFSISVASLRSVQTFESESRSVMSDSLRLHGLYSIVDCTVQFMESPGQNTGVVAFPSPGDLPSPGIEPRFRPLAH